MAKKRSYEFHLSTMLGRMSRSIECGDLDQSLIVSYMNHCCLDTIFDLGCYRVSRSHWRAALHFEHRTYELGSRGVFDGWHKAEIYAIHTNDRDRFYIPADTPEWLTWVPTIFS